MYGGTISPRLATSRADREISPFATLERGAITLELSVVLRTVGGDPQLIVCNVQTIFNLKKNAKTVADLNRLGILGVVKAVNAVQHSGVCMCRVIW